MPKTDKIYTKNINVRISISQYKEWDNYAKENGFDDISKLVRYATDGLIEGRFYNNRKTNRNEALKQRIKTIENDNKNLSGTLEDVLKTQNDILKYVAKKSPSLPEDIPYKQLTINLLQEKPRDEEELHKIFDNLEEIQIYKIVNELMEASIITREKDKLKVIQNG